MKQNVLGRKFRGSQEYKNIDDYIKQVKTDNKLQLRFDSSITSEAKEDDHSVVISFASEIPYLRDFGYEIVKVDQMSLKRLNNKGMLLFNHNVDKYIGVIEKAWIGTDKRAYAKVRFDVTNEDGLKAFKSVLAGILTQVSFGYDVLSYVRVADIDGVPAYEVATEGFEVSFCTIAADPSVGYLRAKRIDEDKKEIEEDKTKEKEEEEIEEKTKKNNIDDTGKSEENQGENGKKLDNDAEKLQYNIINKLERQKMEVELKELKEILNLGRQYGEIELASDFAQRNKTKDDFIQALLEKRSANPSQVQTEIKEIAKSGYSLENIFRSLTNEGISKDAENLSRKFEDLHGTKRKTKNSIYLPMSALRQDVASANTATASNAGALVATHLDNNPILALGNNDILNRLNMQVYNGLDGKLDIPRFNSTWLAEGVAEGAKANGAEFDIDTVTLSPESLSQNIPVTRRMLGQTRFPLGNYIINNLREAISYKLQAELFSRLTALQGKGSVAGTGMDWAGVVDLESAVTYENALKGTGSYIANSRVISKMKTTQKGNGLGFIAEGERDSYYTNGYQVLQTNALAENAGLSKLHFVDGSAIMLGLFSGVEIQVNPYYKGGTGDTLFTVFLDYDFGFRHEKSFAEKSVQTGATGG